ncbi:DUF302 domain-containing protein [Nocardia seriolae]|uniref:AraC effector-binding domain-containing protein n=1 Tax=Nocardia seriolae TaxID=37332 RepID=A0ABC9YYB1_9NOCA|nr:DUF302 domain-containing protein [Nocardia seriolae]APA97777.1 hypothetical protein NS506_03728 [Nocardia seriolae]WKY55072.1 DUF302 domain-containing protein [Nocardia seriolae]WNJ56713.1 DUF302 domain-containing protein [Nocardia seriolae]BEK89442.1 hypothetical protein NSERKGN1266_53930 [Nocardia seriolae]BEK94942.1 hypothetical protein NSER024013_28480 [Nocardia seriolae]
MDYRVDLCETPPHAVLSLPMEIRSEQLAEGILAGMNRIEEVARRAGLTANGAPTITFHRELPTGQAIAVDFGLPIEPAPALGPSSGGDLLIKSPALVARTCHRGGYAGLDAAYRALRGWVRESGYRPVGPPTESYLVGPDQVQDPRLFITEVRIPVAPSPAIAVHVDGRFAVVAERTRMALRDQGFDISTEIDAQAMLRQRAGEHIEEYLILGACHPRLAACALEIERSAGLLLSCSVIVRADETGVVVEAGDPAVQAAAFESPELTALATEAHDLLAAALTDLVRTAAAAS